MIDDVRLDHLTREMGWIRGLARALVARDADDLAQDAWLVAAEQAPADRPLRPWLTRVTGNLARMRGRSSSRRERRELAVETRAIPSPAELVERVELGRVVAAEVIALDEPYRSTILLHFFEGLSSAEIARRQALPDGTVRRRLKVGLDQLRERLRDRRDPPKGGWLAALIPVAGPMPRVKAIAKPAVATTTSSTTIAVAVIVMAIVAGAIWKLASRGDDDAFVSTAPPIARVYPAISPPAPGARPLFDPMRLAQPGAPSRRVAGIVRFAGVPVANATVRLGIEIQSGYVRVSGGPLWQRIAEVTTDGEGRFDFGLRPATHMVITAQALDRAPAANIIEVADPNAHVEELELALAACTTTVSGHVRDAAGTPLVARIETVDLAAVETSPGGDYRLCMGSDRFDRHGLHVDYSIRVTADGYATVENGVAGGGEQRRDFVMVPGAAAVGVVVDELDHRIGGAHVVAVPTPFGTIDLAAIRWTATDSDGRFQIDQLAAGRWAIYAGAPNGGQSSEAIATIAVGVTPTPVRLVVTPRVRVHGRVVKNGSPVSGVEVVHGVFSQLDGTFVMEGVEPGPIRFNVGSGVLAPSRILVDREDVEVELVMTERNRITGHVRHAGVPVAGVSVGDGDSGATTDESGAYGFDAPLWEGEVHEVPVVMHLFCPKAARDAVQRFVVASNQAITADFDVEPCPPSKPAPAVVPQRPAMTKVHGVVTDKGGTAVGGAFVRVGDNGTTADAHGVFAFDVTVTSRPLVYLSRGAQAPLPLLEATGDGSTTPMQLVVDADLMSIHGRVIDNAGALVADARVDIRGVIGVRAGASTDDTYAGTTGPDGVFAIEHLARASNYTLTAIAGALRGEVHGVGGDVEIVVGGNGSIHGDLLGDWDGTPVVIVAANGNEMPAVVGEDEFDLRDLAPGIYEVSAHDGHVEQTAPVWVQSGKVAHVSLRADSGGERYFRQFLELGTSAPVVGLACQTGPHSPIGVSDQGGITSAVRWVTCWSSRGPAVPIKAELDMVDCPSCGSNAGPAVIALIRPGTARPGFVVAPLGYHPIVAVVDDDGAAKEAGLEAGDAIVELDGAGVAQLSAQDLMYLVWTHPRGTLRLAVDRDGSRRDISIPIRE